MRISFGQKSWVIWWQSTGHVIHKALRLGAAETQRPHSPPALYRVFPCSHSTGSPCWPRLGPSPGSEATRLADNGWESVTDDCSHFLLKCFFFLTENAQGWWVDISIMNQWIDQLGVLVEYLLHFQHCVDTQYSPDWLIDWEYLHLSTSINNWLFHFLSFFSDKEIMTFQLQTWLKFKCRYKIKESTDVEFRVESCCQNCYEQWHWGAHPLDGWRL